MFKKILTAALAMLTLFTLFSCSSGKDEKYIVLEEDFGGEQYGIGFRKGDNTLTLAVQQKIDEMIADGKAAEISKKWLGEARILENVDFPAPIEDTGDQSLQKVLDKKELILGLDVGFKPMGFYDDDGNVVGLDIDIAKEVAARLGVELKVQPIDWNAKESELAGGKIDMIWNGMSITESRVEQMNISKPYLNNRMIVIAKESSGIKTLADLKGKKIAVQAGSSALDAINAKPEIMETFGELVEFADNPTAFMDVKVGRCDAIVVDEVVGLNLIAE